ncbi:MAG: hypothetical protein WCH34_12460 [Bacteroidota bacterium]
MYKIAGIIFCLLEGVLIGIFGWSALLWSPLGYFIGLFISAQLILPIILGLPIAVPLVIKKEMRPRVYLALFRTPLIWIIQLSIFCFLLAWVWPSAAKWIIGNQTLNIGLTFGFIAILLTPLSRKGRVDFRIDFDKIYSKYYYDSKIEQNTNLHFSKKQRIQVEAAIKIFTNLYFHTTKTASSVLQFRCPDSKFHYLIFCMSAMIKSCEDIIYDKDLMAIDCIHFLSSFTTEKKNVQEFFNETMDPEEAKNIGSAYFEDFKDGWLSFFEVIKSDNQNEGNSIISSMIYSTETKEPIMPEDKERLSELSWLILSFLPSMQDAFLDSIGRYK